MREVYAVLEVAARSDASVLLEGETGTGKEVVARALHSESKRAKGPFVVIDCGAIPAELAESELFGHMRGSFTGATDTRPGAFERAHGGTLLLDELGELPIDLQPKLLRALESREIRKIGGNEVKKVDVRVVAATNRDLQELIDAGEFRSDLFYRLAVIMVQLPSLRERLEDLPVLVQRMLRDMGLADPGPITGPNLEHLQQHGWPGNVRELRNVLERAVAGVGHEEGRFTSLSVHVGGMRASSMRPSGVPTVDLALPFQVGKERHNDAFELAYLTQLLGDTKGNVAEASRRAQLSRRHLYDLLKKHGLKA
jgi:DNA-binding NtrC family response regulator